MYVCVYCVYELLFLLALAILNENLRAEANNIHCCAHMIDVSLNANTCCIVSVGIVHLHGGIVCIVMSIGNDFIVFWSFVKNGPCFTVIFDTHQ